MNISPTVNMNLAKGKLVSPDSDYQLGPHIVRMGTKGFDGREISSIHHLLFAQQLDVFFDKLQDLVGIENIEIISYILNEESKSLVNLSNKELKGYFSQMFGNENISEHKNSKFRSLNAAKFGGFFEERTFVLLSTPGKIGAKGMKGSFIELVSDEEANEKIKEAAFADSFIPFDDLILMIETIKNDINKVIEEAGIKVTDKIRRNLISLLQNTYLFKLDPIRKVTNVSYRKANKYNVDLIKAAALGYNATLLSMLYVNDYYPVDKEEIEELSNLPFNLLNAVLSGENNS